MSGPLPELRAAELDLLAAVDRSRRHDESIAAWRRWTASVDIDRVDAGTFELLPRLHRRLEELGATAAAGSRIPGVYRFVWSRNQLLLAAAADAGRELDAAGIRTAAIAGTWIGFDRAGDGGIRPLREATLAIDPATAREAVATLLGRGWTTASPGAERRLGRGDSIAMRSPAEAASEVRLCYRLPVQILGIRRLLARSRPAAADDEGGVAVPAPDDLLAELCIEGIVGRPHRRLGWIADAGELLAGGQIDWAQLLCTARDRRIAGHLSVALGQLERLGAGRVPAVTVGALEATGSPRFERAALWGRARRARAPRALAFGYDQHRRHRALGSEDPIARPGPVDCLRQRHGAVDPPP